MLDAQNGRIDFLDTMIQAAKDAGVDEVVEELTKEFEAWKAEQ